MSGGTERRPLVVGNWKMNLSEPLAERLLRELAPPLEALGGVETAVAPPFPCLPVARRLLRGSATTLAAQNVHWEDDGAYTGEVSPRMLADAGVRQVIVGHSERRALFGETDDRVRRKVAAVRRHRLVPILCVGESESQRDSGRTLAVVEQQLRRGLADVAADDAGDVVLAYEPVWAIGTGRAATPTQVDEVHRMIREQLGSLYGAVLAAGIRVLYGGSVTPDNAAELLALPEVDGALVGGASLDAAKFAAIAAVASG